MRMDVPSINTLLQLFILIHPWSEHTPRRKAQAFSGTVVVQCSDHDVVRTDAVHSIRFVALPVSINPFI